MRPDGAKVRALREALGLAIDRVASFARLTPHALERIEAGQGDITAKALSTLTGVLGVDAEALGDAGVGADGDLVIDREEQRPAVEEPTVSKSSDPESQESKGSAFEQAMDRAMDATVHTATDRAAVVAALEFAPAPRVPETELVAIALAWLNAAAALRAADERVAPKDPAQAVVDRSHHPVARKMATDLLKAQGRPAAKGSAEKDTNDAIERVPDEFAQVKAKPASKNNKKAPHAA